MRVLAVALVIGVVLAGCMGPRASCSSSPSMAAVSFRWEGNESDLMDALREEGWDVASKRPRALGWTMRLDPWEGQGDLVPPEGPGNAHVVVQGYHGEATMEEARAELGPAVDPLVARFGGNVTVMPGWSRC